MMISGRHCHIAFVDRTLSSSFQRFLNCLPISHEVDSALDDCAVPVAGDFPEVQSYRDVSGAHAACSALCPRVSEGRLRAPFLSKLKNSVIIHSEAKARQILNQFEF